LGGRHKPNLQKTHIYKLLVNIYKLLVKMTQIYKKSR